MSIDKPSDPEHRFGNTIGFGDEPLGVTLWNPTAQSRNTARMPVLNVIEFLAAKCPRETQAMVQKLGGSHTEQPETPPIAPGRLRLPSVTPFAQCYSGYS